MTNEYLYWKEEPANRIWKKIPDTPEARQQAIQEGAMFFTWTVCSDNGDDEPTRIGNPPFDFDCKEDPGKALQEMRELFLVHLPKLYDLDPHTVRFYATGKKGFGADIPAKIFDAHQGDPYLPLIFKRIIADWAVRFNLTTLDLSMYCTGKGKMYRIPNVQRENGRYKVPLTLDEVRDLDATELMALTEAPREIESVEVDIYEVEELGRDFRTTRAQVHQELTDRPEPVEISPEDCKKLSQELAPCIHHILTKLPPKSDLVNFNKLIMNLANYFQLIGESQSTATSFVKRFLEDYTDTATYNTKEKRITAWGSMWAYVKGNPEYTFNCSYVKGLGLPGSAFECKECIGKENPLLKAIIPIGDFVQLDIPERKSLLHPIIKEASINEIYGPKGVGKTMFAKALAYAVANAIRFGPWDPGVGVPSLYLEGEMVAADVKERCEMFDLKRDGQLYVYSDAYAYAHLPGVPRARLAEKEWQDLMMDALLDLGVKYWGVDNLSSLTPGLDEISKADYDPINQFFLELRFRGISTTFVHHSGKSGAQRGTSSREDNVDTIMKLSRPPDYTQDQGCRFILTFEKARLKQSLLKYATPLEFQLAEDEYKKPVWTYKTAQAAKKIQILRLLGDDYSQKEIGEQLEVDKSYISRMRKQFVDDGFLTAKNIITQAGHRMIFNAENEPEF